MRQAIQYISLIDGHYLSDKTAGEHQKGWAKAKAEVGRYSVKQRVRFYTWCAPSWIK